MASSLVRADRLTLVAKAQIGGGLQVGHCKLLRRYLVRLLEFMVLHHFCCTDFPDYVVRYACYASDP